MWYKKNGQFDENGKEEVDKGNTIICPASIEYPNGITLIAENSSEMDGYDGWQWFEGEFNEEELSSSSVSVSTWDKIKNWTNGLFGR